MGTSVQEVLGHVHSRGLGGAGLGGPCLGVRGRWLIGAAPSVGVAGLPGRCRYAAAEPAGSAIGGHPLLCERAHRGRGAPLPQLGGRRPGLRPHGARVPGGGGGGGAPAAQSGAPGWGGGGGALW